MAITGSVGGDAGLDMASIRRRKDTKSRRWVARRANGRRTASIDVTNDMCGDPARGDRKELEVTYVCGSIAKTASAHEHRTVYLDCTP